jgi:hypothetical protein
MEILFKKVIMKDNFHDGFVDKSLPILFRNYLIERETTPSAFRKEHILRQVYYVMKKYFAPRENTFIKYMTVDVNRHDFEITIITIDNIKYNRTIDHNKYIINFSKTKTYIKDILESTKKHLKRKSDFINVDNHSGRHRDSSSEHGRGRRGTRYGDSKSYNDKTSRKIKQTKDSSKKSDKLSKKSKTKKNILELNFDMIDFGKSAKSNIKNKKHTGLSRLSSKSKSSSKRKLSMLMTASEIKARDKAKNVQLKPAIITGTGVSPPPPAILANKKEQLISPPGAFVGQAPTQALAQTYEPATQQPTTDQDSLRCNPITDQATCFSSNCYWDNKQNTCRKRLPPKKLDYQAPRQFGAPGAFPGFSPAPAAAPAAATPVAAPAVIF